MNMEFDSAGENWSRGALQLLYFLRYDKTWYQTLFSTTNEYKVVVII